MNRFANILQSKNMFKDMINIKQKGFKKNIEGCTEHAATINFLISHAVANKTEHICCNIGL
jgi:hypothetical protein